METFKAGDTVPQTWYVSTNPVRGVFGCSGRSWVEDGERVLEADDGDWSYQILFKTDDPMTEIRFEPKLSIPKKSNGVLFGRDGSLRLG
jgi:hypothetical protein